MAKYCRKVVGSVRATAALWVRTVRIHIGRQKRTHSTPHKKLQKKFPLLREVENNAKAIRLKKRLKLSCYDSLFALVVGSWRGRGCWGGTVAVYV